MDKEELLLRYECDGGEELYAEAKPRFQQIGALNALQDPDDYGISMHYSAAFLLERLGRLAGAAREWRVIIGWCEEHNATIEAAWPRHELQRVEAALGAR